MARERLSGSAREKKRKVLRGGWNWRRKPLKSFKTELGKATARAQPSASLLEPA
jgi:hypothetical protein